MFSWETCEFLPTSIEHRRAAAFEAAFEAAALLSSDNLDYEPLSY